MEERLSGVLSRTNDLAWTFAQITPPPIAQYHTSRIRCTQTRQTYGTAAAYNVFSNEVKSKETFKQAREQEKDA